MIHVLWMVTLLAVIAGTMMTDGKTAYQLARNSVDEAGATAIADAAINRAVLALLEPRTENRWRVDGVPYSFAFAGTSARVTIQDETGRIDLNQAEPTLLAGLFRSVGLDAQSAANLADRILDWRDSGSTRRLNGAKEADYRSAGRVAGPRNGPFQSIDELKLVLGMTSELYQRVESAITVYSGRPSINPQVAPAQALLALPGMSADIVATQMTARTQADNGALSGVALATDASDPLNSLKGRAFTIHADVARPNGSLAREATVRLTDDPSRPFWVLNWRKP